MYSLFVFSGNIIFDYNEVLPLRCGGVGCGNQMAIKRFMKFASKLEASENIYIRRLHQLQKSDLRSTYARNIRYICSLAGVNDISKVNINDIIINPVPAKDDWRVGMLDDLLCERDSPSGFLTELEVIKLIHSVCYDG